MTSSLFCVCVCDLVLFHSQIADNSNHAYGHRSVPGIPLSVSRVTELSPCPEAFEGAVVSHSTGGAEAEKWRERKVK